MSGVTRVQPGRHTLERYWAIFDADDALVDRLVAAVFSADATFSSAALSRPLGGHRQIAHHIRRIRSALDGAVSRHVTDVQWVHDTARWCWRSSGPDRTHLGMDVVQMTPDGERIRHLVVFAGLLPTPAGHDDRGRAAGPPGR